MVLGKGRASLHMISYNSEIISSPLKACEAGPRPIDEEQWLTANRISPPVDAETCVTGLGAAAIRATGLGAAAIRATGICATGIESRAENRQRRGWPAGADPTLRCSPTTTRPRGRRRHRAEW
jgi:hypothetical protein